MKPNYTTYDERLPARRLSRFAAFRASLPSDERACLDAKLERWVDTIKKRRPNIPFSLNYAKELFMAVEEFMNALPGG